MPEKHQLYYSTLQKTDAARFAKTAECMHMLSQQWRNVPVELVFTQIKNIVLVEIKHKYDGVHDRKPFTAGTLSLYLTHNRGTTKFSQVNIGVHRNKKPLDVELEYTQKGNRGDEDNYFMFTFYGDAPYWETLDIVYRFLMADDGCLADNWDQRIEWISKANKFRE